MFSDPYYHAKVASLLDGAKQKERAWVKKNPLLRWIVTRRFPSPFRPYQEYWRDTPPESMVAPRHPPCPRCGTEELDTIDLRESVGHNGDGVGTRYTICPACGWTIWWRYDDGSMY